jgi:HEPN domain-containing protein
MARSFIANARLTLDSTQFFMQRGGYSTTVRRCQEAVELALKAALRSIGIEPPHWHDVGDVLLKNKVRFPAWFANKTEELARISSALRQDREPAMYGEENLGRPPDDLYDDTYANKAIAWATKAVDSCEKLLGQKPPQPSNKGTKKKQP